MVASKAATVDDFLAEADPVRAPVLRRIRECAVRNLPTLAESMRYGMPTYAKDAAAEPAFAFNSQKQYISLYVPPAVHAMHAKAMKSLDAGKSCIRFRKGQQIDFDLLDKLLADTASQDSGC